LYEAVEGCLTVPLKNKKERPDSGDCGMKPASGKELAKALERHDRKFLRVQGSHHIYGKSESIVRLFVPIHGNKILRLGLLKHFLKTAERSEMVTSHGHFSFCGFIL
jgi:predicted RNA binding protein YcfA (HicA-like mRNA interferase family)